MTTYADAVLADSPVHYWRCGDASGNLTDEVGASNLTPGGAPTYSVTGALTGDADTAVEGDGDDDFSGTLGSQPTTAFTVECWVSVGGASTGNNGFCGFDRTFAADEVYVLKLFNDNIEARFSNSAGTQYTITSTGTEGIPGGGWKHYVFTYDGSNIRLYINDSLIDTVAASGSLSTGLTWNVLSENSNFLTGAIDEVAVYDYALSASRISVHYDIGVNGPTGGLSIPVAMHNYRRRRVA